MILLELTEKDVVQRFQEINNSIRRYKVCDTCVNSETVNDDARAIHLRCKSQDRYVSSIETCIDYAFDEDLLTR